MRRTNQNPAQTTRVDNPNMLAAQSAINDMEKEDAGTAKVLSLHSIFIRGAQTVKRTVENILPRIAKNRSTLPHYDRGHVDYYLK